MAEKLDVQRDWSTLCQFLPADYPALAITCGAIRPQYKDTRIRSADELLRMILLHVGADMPLRQTVALVAEGGGPVVSPYCLHMRMRRAAPYLQALVKGLRSPHAIEPMTWAGYDLIAVDASSFAGRCATGTDARIHAALRLSDLSIVAAHSTDRSVGESLRRFHWERDQLVIADRGYSHANGVVWVKEHGADVVVRLNRNAMPLHDRRDEVIDVVRWARSIPNDRIVERFARVRVWIDGHLKEVAGRLIATRLPEDKIADAERRVLESQGRNVTEETIEMAAYVLLFTTVPKERLSAEQCLEAYRNRWQIELLFKRWKSLCGFDRLPNARTDTIESWLSAKILLGLLVDRMAAAAPVLFPPAAQEGRAAAADRSRRPVEDRKHRVAGGRRRAHAASPA